jgi:hypothetical protein
MDNRLAYEQALARNLATAYIATEQGIGLDYARKKYADQPLGEFWISLARMVMEHVGKHSAPAPPISPRIQ